MIIGDKMELSRKDENVWWSIEKGKFGQDYKEINQ